MFELATSASAYVRLVIYDVMGREVRRLVDREQKAGYYRVAWNGRTERGTPAAAGVYFYRLETEKFTATREVVLVR